MILEINRGIVIQISVALLSCYASFLTGFCSGWTSPMTTYYTSENTNLESGPMTMEEISLMSSLVYIGAILGALLSGWLVNAIGRKWSLIIWLFPQILASILTILAKGPLLLLISRTINGTIIGLSLVVPPIFATEIVENKLKATVGIFVGVIFDVGLFFCKLLTGLFGIFAIPIVSIPFILIFIGCLWICSDTPEYLLFRKRINEAEKALRFYRGLPSDQPLPETNALEFEEMKKQVSLRSETTSISLKDFGESTIILGIIISFVLINTLNFGGIRIITTFTQVFIKDSDLNVDLALVDTCISSLQIIGCLASVYIVRRIGSRLALLISFFIGFVAFLGTGIHYYLHYSYNLDLNSISWSFLIFFAISVIVPTTGLNNVCLSIPALILPLKIRGSVIGFVHVLSFALAVFFMHFHLYLVEIIGNSTILMTYSFWCFFGVIFTFFFIPEVKNLTFAEIVSALDQKLPKIFRNSL